MDGVRRVDGPLEGNGEVQEEEVMSIEGEEEEAGARGEGEGGIHYRRVQVTHNWTKKCCKYISN